MTHEYSPPVLPSVSDARAAVFAAELHYHRPHATEEAKAAAWAKRIETLDVFEKAVDRDACDDYRKGHEWLRTERDEAVVARAIDSALLTSLRTRLAEVERERDAAVRLSLIPRWDDDLHRALVQSGIEARKRSEGATGTPKERARLAWLAGAAMGEAIGYVKAITRCDAALRALSRSGEEPGSGAGEGGDRG